MDHRVSKDMISSGMTPSGERSQSDLGKSQYGSAPSPNRLMDAYHSMYQDQKQENLDEGKIPAGLQAYLDKKKGKKKDDDGDEKKDKKDKKDMKEGAGLYANIHAKRKRGGKMRKRGAKGAPSSQDFANAAKTAKEDVDMFDAILNHYVNEGYDEKDVIQAMSSLTEEQLQENPLLALGPALKAVTSIAGKGALKKGAAFLAKQGAGREGLKNVATAFKNPTMSNIGKAAGNVGSGAINVKFKTDVAKSMLPGGGGGSQSQSSNETNKTGKRTAQYASTDLFDIVKGQLLDEGLSEEEIKDIMLELTPEEIIKELEESSMSAGEGDDRHMGTDGVARTKQQVANMFNKNVPRKENTGGKVDKMTRKAINTTARDLKIQGPTTLKQSVEPKGDVI